MARPEPKARRYAILAVAFAAVFAFPFYLGLIHLPLRQFALYSGAAGAAMAVEQYLGEPNSRGAGLKLFAMEAALWAAIVLVLGSVAYAVALIF